MSVTDIQDRIYMFAAETFAEADKADQMGEALYAFTEMVLKWTPMLLLWSG